MSLTNVIGLVGAGFDNWLDAVDESFCTYEGGDVLGEVSSKSLFDFFILFLTLF